MANPYAPGRRAARLPSDHVGWVGGQSLAVPANSREPINELDKVLGTGGDNPRLPLQL
jgi:hypothetical protein